MEEGEISKRKRFEISVEVLVCANKARKDMQLRMQPDSALKIDNEQLLLQKESKKGAEFKIYKNEEEVMGILHSSECPSTCNIYILLNISWKLKMLVLNFDFK